MKTRRSLGVALSLLIIPLTLSLAGCAQSGGKRSAVASASAAVSASAAPSASAADDQTAAPSASAADDQTAAILAGVTANMDAMNNEDLDAYMACLDPASPMYDSTRSQMEAAFEQYDLHVEASDVYLVDVSGTVAHVHAVVTTVKVSGPAFNDNRVTAVFELHKVDGAWKLFGQTLSDVEYL
jgi:ketosteroid isomerase-like protein